MDKQTEDSNFRGASVGHGSKKSNLEQKSLNSLSEQKNNCKLNPFMETMIHMSNIHYSRINPKRKLKKAYKISSGTTKNETCQAPKSALHLEGELGILDVDTQLNSSMQKEKALKQPIILNPYTNLNFSSNNPYF